MPGGKQARARYLRSLECAVCGHTGYDHAKWGIFGWWIGLGSCNVEGCTCKDWVRSFN